MVHLSVAVGRFFEALFWSMLQSAGIVALAVLAGAAGIGLVFLVAWRAFRRPGRRAG